LNFEFVSDFEIRISDFPPPPFRARFPFHPPFHFNLPPMRLGTVIGRVTLTQQEPVYSGSRLLIVQPLSKEQFANPALCREAGGPAQPLAKGSSLVIIDQLGAGLGSIVGFTEGAEATQPFNGPAPVDAYNACIVDQIFYQPPK
jgi:microcompartment protein CcmK/EutM